MKYSIITVNYNNKDGLQNTIESVINQSFHDFEYIIIDGGSNDGSVDVIKQYEEHINYWISEPDNGIYHAMNKGIAKAKGDYLNFMNSGDAFYDSERLQLIEKEGFDSDMIIGSDYWYNAATGKDFATILPLRLDMFTFYIGSLPHQSTFFKRTLFNNYQYDEMLKVVSDWKFYIQKIIGEGCSIAFFHNVITKKDPKDGVGYTLQDISKIEREDFIASYLPVGIRRHYETLQKFEPSTFYKMMEICDNPKSLRYLTYAIKILFRLFHKN